MELDTENRYLEIKKNGLNLRLDLDIEPVDEKTVKINVKGAAGPEDSWRFDDQLKPIKERIDH